MHPNKIETFVVHMPAGLVHFTIYYSPFHLQSSVLNTSGPDLESLKPIKFK